MKKYLIIFLLIMLMTFISEGSDGRRVIYKYRKYQKFDFESMSIGGDTGSPGDLSIRPRKQKGFKNKLPFRKNFISNIRRTVETVR